MIPIINSLTSLLGGFAIFPMLGYLSNETGQPIEDLDLSGFGITFVAYTQGLATFPNGVAQFCSVCHPRTHTHARGRPPPIPSHSLPRYICIRMRANASEPDPSPFPFSSSFPPLSLSLSFCSFLFSFPIDRSSSSS